MCGRYKISTKAPQILEAFEVDVVDDVDAAAVAIGTKPPPPAEGEGAAAAEVRVRYEPAPRFNVAPTDPVPCVRVLDDGKRHLSPLRFGLLPFWAKSRGEGARMINARAEGLLSKRAFKEALEKRRCLVVADGFYEWLAVPGAAKAKDKQPYLLCFEDRHVFAFAGLWARWRSPEGAVVESCTVITRPPNSVAGKIHDRMPVILDSKEEQARWLDVTTPVDVEELQKPHELPGFVAFPVDKRVGSVKLDEPSLAEPVALQATLV